MAKKQLSLEKLAHEIGTTARSLSEWRKLDGAPTERDAGKWRTFMQERGLGPYSLRQNAPAFPSTEKKANDARSAGQDQGSEERALRLRREKVQLDIAEFNLEKAKEQMLPIAEFEQALAVTIGNFRSVGNHLPGRAAAKVATRATAAILRMLKGALTAKQYEKVEAAITAAPIDFADVEEILQNEWDLVLRTLETCDYLKTPPVSPTDERHLG